MKAKRNDIRKWTEWNERRSASRDAGGSENKRPHWGKEATRRTAERVETTAHRLKIDLSRVSLAAQCVTAKVTDNTKLKTDTKIGFVRVP